jgi:hypothetical protein
MLEMREGRLVWPAPDMPMRCDVRRAKPLMEAALVG